MNSTNIEQKFSRSDTTFNTLELTSDFTTSKTRESLYRRALQKKKTLTKLVSIIDTLRCKKEQKKYWKTYHCQNVLLQLGKTFKGSLCRKRWCTHCCRIKTAELIKGYKEPLKNLGELYFVTLTRPNVKGRELNSEVKKLIKGFQRIKDNLRKNYKVKLNGIRKIEVTYNSIENTYHPHFHFIQNDLIASQLLQKLWLEQFPTATHKAQDIRPIDATNENSFIELFKYATKETTKDGKQYNGDVLHTIYKSLEGLRIYQTYGELKKVKEPIETKETKNEYRWIEPKNEIWIYDIEQIDYTTAYGEKLINFDYENEKRTHSFKTFTTTNNQNKHQRKAETY